MAWQWSHTDKAVQTAHDNMAKLPTKSLIEIFGEWEAEGKNGFSERKYKAAVRKAKTLERETLVEFIWEKMDEQRLCTNGGHYAYCCPHGCTTHVVGFHGKD